MGILGGTGSAKSTLVQLIPRLYDVTEGTVRVGGRDVREYDLPRCGTPWALCCRKTCCSPARCGRTSSGATRRRRRDPLGGLPGGLRRRVPGADAGGLDTDLGQGGVNVSGGQKQRLCIARALLKKPKVLIFDDSTSAVDTATEAKIRAALAQLTDVTKIIIAQRITSVMDADQIVILEDGRIHAVGTHRQLLAEDPIYQEIYAPR